MSNKGSDPDVIPPLEKDGVTYYTNKEKAAILNQFFINQSTTEDNDDVPDVPERLSSINEINLSVEEIKNTLTKLSTGKATGPDQIHNILFKKSAGIISEPLTFLFNRSLNEGIFFQQSGKQHTLHQFIKGNKEQRTNYRPISLLSCVGKTLEKCVHRHVSNYLNANQITTPSQSGFTPKDSTVYWLLSIYTMTFVSHLTVK